MTAHKLFLKNRPTLPVAAMVLREGERRPNELNGTLCAGLATRFLQRRSSNALSARAKRCCLILNKVR